MQYADAAEARDELIHNVRAAVDYWRETRHSPGHTESERLSGLAHSLLVLLDGQAGGPAFVLEVEDQPEIRIADMLHEYLYAGTWR